MFLLMRTVPEISLTTLPLISTDSTWLMTWLLITVAVALDSTLMTCVACPS